MNTKTYDVDKGTHRSPVLNISSPSDDDYQRRNHKRRSPGARQSSSCKRKSPRNTSGVVTNSYIHQNLSKNRRVSPSVQSQSWTSVDRPVRPKGCAHYFFKFVTCRGTITPMGSPDWPDANSTAFGSRSGTPEAIHSTGRTDKIPNEDIHSHSNPHAQMSEAAVEQSRGKNHRQEQLATDVPAITFQSASMHDAGNQRTVVSDSGGDEMTRLMVDADDAQYLTAVSEQVYPPSTDSIVQKDFESMPGLGISGDMAWNNSYSNKVEQSMTSEHPEQSARSSCKTNRERADSYGSQAEILERLSQSIARAKRGKSGNKARQNRPNKNQESASTNQGVSNGVNGKRQMSENLGMNCVEVEKSYIDHVRSHLYTGRRLVQLNQKTKMAARSLSGKFMNLGLNSREEKHQKCPSTINSNPPPLKPISDLKIKRSRQASLWPSVLTEVKHVNLGYKGGQRDQEVDISGTVHQSSTLHKRIQETFRIAEEALKTTTPHSPVSESCLSSDVRSDKLINLSLQELVNSSLEASSALQKQLLQRTNCEKSLNSMSFTKVPYPSSEADEKSRKHYFDNKTQSTHSVGTKLELPGNKPSKVRHSLVPVSAKMFENKNSETMQLIENTATDIPISKSITTSRDNDCTESTALLRHIPRPASTQMLDKEQTHLDEKENCQHEVAPNTTGERNRPNCADGARTEHLPSLSLGDGNDDDAVKGNLHVENLKGRRQFGEYTSEARYGDIGEPRNAMIHVSDSNGPQHAAKFSSPINPASTYKETQFRGTAVFSEKQVVPFHGQIATTKILSGTVKDNDSVVLDIQDAAIKKEQSGVSRKESCSVSRVMMEESPNSANEINVAVTETNVPVSQYVVLEDKIPKVIDDRKVESQPSAPKSNEGFNGQELGTAHQDEFFMYNEELVKKYSYDVIYSHVPKKSQTNEQRHPCRNTEMTKNDHSTNVKTTDGRPTLLDERNTTTHMNTYEGYSAVTLDAKDGSVKRSQDSPNGIPEVDSSTGCGQKDDFAIEDNSHLLFKGEDEGCDVNDETKHFEYQLPKHENGCEMFENNHNVNRKYASELNRTINCDTVKNKVKQRHKSARACNQGTQNVQDTGQLRLKKMKSPSQVRRRQSVLLPLQQHPVEKVLYSKADDDGKTKKLEINIPSAKGKFNPVTLDMDIDRQATVMVVQHPEGIALRQRLRPNMTPVARICVSPENTIDEDAITVDVVSDKSISESEKRVQYSADTLPKGLMKGRRASVSVDLYVTPNQGKSPVSVRCNPEDDSTTFSLKKLSNPQSFDNDNDDSLQSCNMSMNNHQLPQHSTETSVLRPCKFDDQIEISQLQNVKRCSPTKCTFRRHGADEHSKEHGNVPPDEKGCNETVVQTDSNNYRESGERQSQLADNFCDSDPQKGSLGSCNATADLELKRTRVESSDPGTTTSNESLVLCDTNEHVETRKKNSKLSLENMNIDVGLKSSDISLSRMTQHSNINSTAASCMSDTSMTIPCFSSVSKVSSNMYSYDSDFETPTYSTQSDCSYTSLSCSNSRYLSDSRNSSYTNSSNLLRKKSSCSHTEDGFQMHLSSPETSSVEEEHEDGSFSGDFLAEVDTQAQLVFEKHSKRNVDKDKKAKFQESTKEVSVEVHDRRRPKNATSIKTVHSNTEPHKQLLFSTGLHWQNVTENGCKITPNMLVRNYELAHKKDAKTDAVVISTRNIKNVSFIKESQCMLPRINEKTDGRHNIWPASLQTHRNRKKPEVTFPKIEYQRSDSLVGKHQQRIRAIDVRHSDIKPRGDIRGLVFQRPIELNGNKIISNDDWKLPVLPPIQSKRNCGNKPTYVQRNFEFEGNPNPGSLLYVSRRQQNAITVIRRHFSEDQPYVKLSAEQSDKSLLRKKKKTVDRKRAKRQKSRTVCTDTGKKFVNGGQVVPQNLSFHGKTVCEVNNDLGFKNDRRLVTKQNVNQSFERLMQNFKFRS